MTEHRMRISVGARFILDGELVEIIETRTDEYGGGTRLTVKNPARDEVFCVSCNALLTDSRRYRPVEPDPDNEAPEDVAATILSSLDERTLQEISERAGHIRELLTGHRSGSAETAGTDEPRPQYAPSVPTLDRLNAKAAELGVSLRTLQRWLSDYRAHGEAGLVRRSTVRGKIVPSIDERWMQTALEVMVEHTDESRPSRTMVINRTNARVCARHGDGVVSIPSRATAFRALEVLERRQPTFRLSTKRNRDIAARPDEAYGKLRPSRPGEYVLMDTTRLDVFALDPITLRWVQVELTIVMDWYTRCIIGIRLTPVSTKSVDAATVLYECFRPHLAPRHWPAKAAWPEHGIPRSLLIDVDSSGAASRGKTGPTIVPETVVIDHGKIYISQHMTSVCERLGISIQPARLRTGRDKGPIERFFRTIREDLLQALPGYKGPDVHSRGTRPEDDAHFYIDELEAIIREWVAVVYHRRPHDGLLDPHLAGLEMSPVAMFEHGVARAGFIEAPSDPDLAFEFLQTQWRTVQHYGVELRGMRYNGSALNSYRNQQSPYLGKHKGQWPIHYHPDDVSRVYFRDPTTHGWHTLMWEHADAFTLPFSEDALKFARKLAERKYKYPNDQLAMAELLERWNLGLGKTLAERRIALRLDREAKLLTDAEADAEVTGASRLIASAIARANHSETPSATDDISDVDEDTPTNTNDEQEPTDPEDFYADAWEDA
ncbi:transposase InsO family protein [Mycobacterium sp. MAA66]|uniref:helix-turn-helix domain-containing protein n=1 Tax=Mycobacterium sp. MAA66 TaxID=3156297 RepID=UPI00351300CB